MAQHISQIESRWSQLLAARGDDPAARLARRELVSRYHDAVHRYLLGATHSQEAADDLAQEFAARFLAAGLPGADRARGRFRDYLKGVLRHLLHERHRAVGKTPAPLPENLAEQVAGETLNPDDEQFLTCWRDNLMGRAWAGLAAGDARNQSRYFAVLRYRADHPDDSSEAMAAALAEQFGTPQTPAGVRQTLHRARLRFAELLRDEVRATLDEPDDEELAQELIDLGLYEYCADDPKAAGGR